MPLMVIECFTNAYMDLLHVNTSPLEQCLFLCIIPDLCSTLINADVIDVDNMNYVRYSELCFVNKIE